MFTDSYPATRFLNDITQYFWRYFSRYKWEYKMMLLWVLNFIKLVAGNWSENAWFLVYLQLSVVYTEFSSIPMEKSWSHWVFLLFHIHLEDKICYRNMVQIYCTYTMAVAVAAIPCSRILFPIFHSCTI